MSIRAVFLIVFSILISMNLSAQENNLSSEPCAGKEQGQLVVGAWSAVSEAMLIRYRESRLDYQYDVMDMLVKKNRVKQLDGGNTVCLLGRSDKSDSVHVIGLGESEGYWVNAADYQVN